MTPLEYEAAYHKLSVQLADTTFTTVDVRRYQNNDPGLKENANLGNKAALVRKDALVGGLDAEVRQLTKDPPKPKGKPADPPRLMDDAVAEFYRVGHMVHLQQAAVLRQFRSKIMGVFSGKGSPDEIATALHLVACYKLYDKAFTDPAAGVRDYCDKFIGLDCNGFVGNYSRAAGFGREPNTTISTYAPAKKRRTKIEDVQANDVLVWLDFGHITVIDSVGATGTGADKKPARDCVVVESTAANPSGGPGTQNGGLQHSTYCLRSVKDGVFQVERPKGKGLTRVYIAPLSAS